MSELSRRSSRQPLLSDDANSLTSFPDPATSEQDTQESHWSADDVHKHESLHGLLDGTGPSMFDESNDGATTEAQALSAVPNAVLGDIVQYHGAVDLVRRLATLLAERDAYISALTRLAEEFKVPKERIADAAQRAQRSEGQRLSLTAAALEPLTRDPDTMLGEALSPLPTPPPLERSGTVRGLTRIFGGSVRQPRGPNDTIKATQTIRRKAGRPPSIRSADTQSIQSQESGNWAINLFGGGRGIKETPPQPRQPLELVTQHDRDQLPPTLLNDSKDPHEAQWNRFIVRINEARAQNGEPQEGSELIGISRFRQQGAPGQQRLRALTHLVLGGIPIKIRQPIWMELSNTYTMVTPGGYEHYLNLAPDGAHDEIDEIMKDVPRTLTTKFDFYTDKGYERLKKVLVAFVNRNEGLGYTQGLNTIAGYLLLAIPSEEDAFWALCNIIENFFPTEYFSRTSHMCGPLADNIVLRQCIRDLLPQLANHLDKLGIENDHTVPLNWFFTAFSTVLPHEVLMRVWDVWLCLPNQKSFIFNMALTLMSRNSSHLLECETEGEYWAYLDNCTMSVGMEKEQINEMIKQAFLMRKRLEHVEDRRLVEFKVLRRKRDSTEALYGASQDG